MDQLKEEMSKEFQAQTYVMEISGQLLLNFGKDAVPMSKTHFMNYYAKQLQDHKNLIEDELLDTLCFFCDLVQYGYNEDVSMMNELCNMFLQISKARAEEDSANINQTLAFGMGVFAHYIPKGSFTNMPEVVAFLTGLISSPEAFTDDELLECSENAISAFLKVSSFQKEGTMIHDELICNLLSKLPLKEDEEEAKNCHKFLCQ